MRKNGEEESRGVWRSGMAGKNRNREIANDRKYSLVKRQEGQGEEEYLVSRRMFVGHYRQTRKVR